MTSLLFSSSSKRDLVNSSSLIISSAILTVKLASGEVLYKYERICSEILLRFFFDIEGIGFCVWQCFYSLSRGLEYRLKNRKIFIPLKSGFFMSYAKRRNVSYEFYSCEDLSLAVQQQSDIARVIVDIRPDLAQEVLCANRAKEIMIERLMARNVGERRFEVGVKRSLTGRVRGYYIKVNSV